MAETEASATGAEGARTASALVAERARELLAGLALARTLDAEGVHQARVASRRLRAALGISSSRRCARAARRVRAITRGLGPVRELDVAHDLVLALAPALGPGDAGAIATFARRLATVRARRAARARRRLLGARGLERRLGALVARLAAREERDEGAWAAHTSRRARARAKRLEAAIARVGHRFAPEPLHRVRVAAKKLRYALELSRSPRHAAHLATLRAAQRDLGELHDLVVLRAFVAEALGESSAADRPGLRRLAARALRGCRALHARYLTQRPRLLACCAEVRAA